MKMIAYIFLSSLFICNMAWAGSEVAIEINNSLSQICATKLRDGYYRSKEESDAGSILKAKSLTVEDLWFNTVRVSLSKINEEKFCGTSFIVADSRPGSLLNHRNYLPFNYSYNPTHGEYSPKLYLISNAHVLMQTPQDGYTGYMFDFHYARSTPDKDSVASDDFKIVRVNIPISQLGIISHKDDEDGHQIDLACFPLNRIFDALHDCASLSGYNPVFAAFDTLVHMTPCGSDYKLDDLLNMPGYPDGQKDVERNLPLTTRGYCATHPAHLNCDTVGWKFSRTARSGLSLVDFKMDISSIGGSSGSAIADLTKSTSRLLGILWGKHQTRLIGFAISAKRLKDWVESNAIPVSDMSLTLVVDPSTAPAPASGGDDAGAGAGSRMLVAPMSADAIRGLGARVDASKAMAVASDSGLRHISTSMHYFDWGASVQAPAAGGAGTRIGSIVAPAAVSGSRSVSSTAATYEAETEIKLPKDKISRTITVAKDSQITSLIIKSGLYLDSFQVTFKDREGSNSNSFTIGGDGGDQSLCDIHEGEYLMHISGMYNGEGLYQVIFRTNFGRVFGPFGKFPIMMGRVTPFEGKLFNSFTLTKNSKIEGEIGITDLLVDGSLKTTILPNSLYFLE